ncbi:hypothetical protein ACXR2U_23820, partial [Jatrophihabitans sp. YIM 134969]
MTSTLAPMRRLSVRFGPTTVDLAVPLGTLVRDLLGSGGFPAGSRMVDASGAALADDDRVGETVEDGAILYVVDSAHTPSLTRVAPTGTARWAGTVAPTRATDTGSATAPPTASGPATGAAVTSSQVFVDPASAGSRTRATGR